MTKDLPCLNVVVGFPHSDIGKGWITTALASHIADPFVLKIDPMLEQTFPDQLGIPCEGGIVSDDVANYRKAGVRFHKDQNILIGKAVNTYLLDPYSIGVSGDTKKKTWSDVACQLAMYIAKLRGDSGCSGDTLVEIGGCPDDMEAMFLPLTIRQLGLLFGVKPRMHLVTQFGIAQGKEGLEAKTREVARAIELACSQYWGTDLAGVYVRTPAVLSLSDNMRQELFVKIAGKVGIPVSTLIHVPHVLSAMDLREFIA